MKDIRKASTSKHIAKIKNQNLRTYYLGITKYGEIKFKTTSGTTPGKFWYQTIVLKDLRDAVLLKKKDKTLKDIQVVSLALSGDIYSHCNDPSYKYYFQYQATQLGYALLANNQKPKNLHPDHTCKHLLAVYQRLPAHLMKLTADLRKQGLLNPEYWEKRK